MHRGILGGWAETVAALGAEEGDEPELAIIRSGAKVQLIYGTAAVSRTFATEGLAEDYAAGLAEEVLTERRTTARRIIDYFTMQALDAQRGRR